MDIKVEEASRVLEERMRTLRAMHGSPHGTVPSLMERSGRFPSKMADRRTCVGLA